MIKVHVIYDSAVFLKEKSGTLLNIQTIVEEPIIHLFVLNSSSIEDQASIIPDRVECLEGLDQPVYTSGGVPIHDIVRFFVGDHPSKQFERGTNVGGVYKCGSCGCKVEMMDDQQWRPHRGGIWGRCPPPPPPPALWRPLPPPHPLSSTALCTGRRKIMLEYYIYFCVPVRGHKAMPR